MKADNILVETTGVCKISDFGISKRTNDIESAAYTSMQGTIFWMAPEVIELKGASTKSDIWSLGCTVIELLTGRPPYGEIANSMSGKPFIGHLSPIVAESLPQ